MDRPDDALARAMVDVAGGPLRAAGTAQVVEWDGGRGCRGPEPTLFDGLSAAGDPPDAAATTAALVALFAGAPSWRADLRVTSTPALQRELGAAGLSVADGMPAMTAPASDVATGSAPWAELRAVERDDVEAWAEVSSTVFGAPPALLARSVALALDRPEGTCLLALDAGRPVGTAVGVTSGDVVVVFGVAVLPEARGRGLGAALTAAAVEAGRRRGATLAGLLATPDGEPVYRRMGFRAGDRWQRWTTGG